MTAPNHWFIADFETFWSVDYSLSKMSALEYVHDFRFEIQCLSYQCGALGAHQPVTLYGNDVVTFMETHRETLASLVLVGQNTIGFDALIFKRYGVDFRWHIDLKIISQYFWGSTVRKHSLEAISERLNLTVPMVYRDTVQSLLGLSDVDVQNSRKLGQALSATKGLYLAVMPDNLRQALGTYCEADVWLPAQAVMAIGTTLPPITYRTMTYNAHALINTPLRLDVTMLGDLKDDYQHQRRAELMAMWWVLPESIREVMQSTSAPKKGQQLDPETIMMKYIRSKDKLVWLFGMLGASDVPQKAGKNGSIAAVSKTDLAFVAFGERYEATEPTVSELVKLRLEYASSASESKLSRYRRVADVFLDHRWGMHVNTFGATNTARHSGGNASGNSPHNLKRAKPMFITSCGVPIRWHEDRGVRDAITAPPGRSLLVYDSSGIELRAVGFLTQEPGITGPMNDRARDVYVEFARTIYNNPNLTKKDKAERFLGKLGCLSLQYLTGPKRLALTAALWGNPISMDEATKAHAAYRVAMPNVVKFWGYVEFMLRYWMGDGRPPPEHVGCTLHEDDSYRLNGCNAVTLMPDGLMMPNGFRIRYPNLRFDMRGDFKGYNYWNAARNSRQRLHPGLVLENCSQAIVTQVMDWQLDQIVQDVARQQLDVVYAGQVHDENIFTTHPDHGDAAGAIIQHWMRTPPPWWPQLVLDCEGGNGYGLVEDEAPERALHRYGFAK